MEVINLEIRIRTVIGSDDQFNDLVAYIESDDGSYIGIISQEEGFNKLKIHLPIGIDYPKIKTPEKDWLTFDLKEFEEAIKKAKERLWELRRTESPENKDES